MVPVVCETLSPICFRNDLKSHFAVSENSSLRLKLRLARFSAVSRNEEPGLPRWQWSEERGEKCGWIIYRVPTVCWDGVPTVCWEWFWGSLTLLVSHSDFGFVHKESESYRDQTCVPGARGWHPKPEPPACFQVFFSFHWAQDLTFTS